MRPALVVIAKMQFVLRLSIFFGGVLYGLKWLQTLGPAFVTSACMTTSVCLCHDEPLCPDGVVGGGQKLE